jgi:hypothetical protein
MSRRVKASRLIAQLQEQVRKHGDLYVEIETDLEIVPAVRIRFNESDSAAGDSIIIVGSPQP